MISLIVSLGDGYFRIGFRIIARVHGDREILSGKLRGFEEFVNDEMSTYEDNTSYQDK